MKKESLVLVQFKNVQAFPNFCHISNDPEVMSMNVSNQIWKHFDL